MGQLPIVTAPVEVIVPVTARPVSEIMARELKLTAASDVSLPVDVCK